jgi:hypothetical protein
MKPGIFEILQEAEKQPNRILKAEVLQKNSGQLLHMVLHTAFHPDMKWELPEGSPPYQPTILQGQEESLYVHARMFKYFIPDLSPNLSPKKRDLMFCQMLECVHPKDAELLIAIKDKKMPVWAKSITPDVVKFAFPGLLD